ncbi:MAG: hypothetical protein Tsb0020_40700 [Haliangiales bacterium]
MISGTSESGSLDRYVVLEYLAEGGMGAIFLGKKLGAGGFEKPVVLKQLLPEFTSQPEFTDLFLNEARLSATLDHANIIHTIDLVTAGDEHFIVMEYLAGADLRTLLIKAKRRRRRFSPAAGIYMAREILSALSYAHAKRGPDGLPLKLIHRDVSPSNILISHNGEVKLTDFGIAKVATHNSVFYRVKGKIGYMSPEQAKGEELDKRSDLYSLAICLYEALTGERLFVHAGITTSADEMFSQPIPEVSKKVRGVPPAFDQVLLKALALNPDQRYQSAGEFQEALLRVAHQTGLMMSTPDLAAELVKVAGDPARWRDLEGEEEQDEYFEDHAEGTERIELDELGDSEQRTVEEQAPTLDSHAQREQRSATSMTNLERFRGLELTSMIRLPNAPAPHDLPHGSQPLVDLSDLGGLGDLAAAESGAMPLADDTVGFRQDEIDFGLSDAPSDKLLGPPDTVPPGLVQPLRPATPHAPAAPVYQPPQPPQAVDPTRPEPRVALKATRETTKSRRSWLIWTLILLAGIGAAIAVALSGPKVAEDSTPAGSAAPTSDAGASVPPR